MKNDCFHSCRPYLSAPIPNVSFFGIPPRSCTPYRMNLQRLKGTLDAFNYGFTVDEIGEGRVWSGYDAKSIGLIDTYGGIEKAIEIAGTLAKIEDYRIISLPKKKDPFKELALKLGKETKISKLFMQKLGLKADLVNSIEDLLQEDIIQTRIPFIIELK